MFIEERKDPSHGSSRQSNEHIGKGKGVKDQVSDEEESGKDGETSMASKVRKKRRRTSEALQFLQVKSEKEADARKEEISFKKEMAEKEAEARREDIAQKR